MESGLVGSVRRLDHIAVVCGMGHDDMRRFQEMLKERRLAECMTVEEIAQLQHVLGKASDCMAYIRSKVGRRVETLDKMLDETMPAVSVDLDHVLAVEKSVYDTSNLTRLVPKSA